MLTLNRQFHDLASGGSTTLNMNTSIFSNIQILKPPAPFLSIFFEKVNPLIEKIEAGENNTVILNTLRDTLLPKLISGELRVADAEKFLGEVGV